MFVTEHPRNKPRDCIDEHDCSNRAIRQYVIADRNLKIDKVFDNAVIDPLVMTADNDEVRLTRKPLRDRLIETASSRRHEHDLRCRVFGVRRSISKIFNRRKNRFWLHDHPLAAAKRRVINNVMFILRPVAQVMDVKIDSSIFLRTFHDAFAQRRPADFRE